MMTSKDFSGPQLHGSRLRIREMTSPRCYMYNGQSLPEMGLIVQESSNTLRQPASHYYITTVTFAP